MHQKTRCLLLFTIFVSPSFQGEPGTDNTIAGQKGENGNRGMQVCEVTHHGQLGRVISTEIECMLKVDENR